MICHPYIDAFPPGAPPAPPVRANKVRHSTPGSIPSGPAPPLRRHSKASRSSTSVAPVMERQLGLADAGPITECREMLEPAEDAGGEAMAEPGCVRRMIATADLCLALGCLQEREETLRHALRCEEGSARWATTYRGLQRQEAARRASLVAAEAADSRRLEHFPLFVALLLEEAQSRRGLVVAEATHASHLLRRQLTARRTLPPPAKNPVPHPAERPARRAPTALADIMALVAATLQAEATRLTPPGPAEPTGRTVHCPYSFTGPALVTPLSLAVAAESPPCPPAHPAGPLSPLSSPSVSSPLEPLQPLSPTDQLPESLPQGSDSPMRPNVKAAPASAASGPSHRSRASEAPPPARSASSQPGGGPRWGLPRIPAGANRAGRTPRAPVPPQNGAPTLLSILRQHQQQQRHSGDGEDRGGWTPAASGDPTHSTPDGLTDSGGSPTPPSAGRSDQRSAALAANEGGAVTQALVSTPPSSLSALDGGPPDPSGGGTGWTSACSHSKFWKRLRAKRGYAYFACFQCGVKWRVSSAGLAPGVGPPAALLSVADGLSGAL